MVAKNILLVAYGNPLRRDDGAGLELARRVYAALRHSRPKGTRTTRLLELHQLVPELVNELADPTLAALFFFDCQWQGARGKGQASEIQICNLQPATCLPATFAHYLTAQTLLAIASTLNGYAPPAWLVTVPGHDFGMGEGFSEGASQLLNSAPKIANIIVDMVGL